MKSRISVCLVSARQSARVMRPSAGLIGVSLVFVTTFTLVGDLTCTVTVRVTVLVGLVSELAIPAARSAAQMAASTFQFIVYACWSGGGCGGGWLVPLGTDSKCLI